MPHCLQPACKLTSTIWCLAKLALTAAHRRPENARDHALARPMYTLQDDCDALWQHWSGWWSNINCRHPWSFLTSGINPCVFSDRHAVCLKVWSSQHNAWLAGPAATRVQRFSTTALAKQDTASVREAFSPRSERARIGSACPTPGPYPSLPCSAQLFSSLAFQDQRPRQQTVTTQRASNHLRICMHSDRQTLGPI